jgi:rod shape-determining protein MreC
LRALMNLESLDAFERKTCSIIGSSPNNFNQQVEIDCGSVDSLRVGMPVINDAGLVGKITRVSLETSLVMLVTDPLYHIQAKVIAEVNPAPPTTVEATVPSGLPVDDVTTTTTTSVPPSTAPSSTDDSDTTTTSTTLPTGSTAPDGSTPDGSVPDGASTTSTTTTTVVPATRETGVLNGFGGQNLPRVNLIADSGLFGKVQIGDAVLTAGGSDSLAPPNIPIGRVANVISGVGVEGLDLEVELNADLERLDFLTVILYAAPREATAL